MIELEGVYFDSTIGRYRFSDGRRISTAELRLVVNGERLKLEGRLLTITERYLSGELTTEEWQRLIMAEIKESNIIILILAAGGHIALNANRQNRQYFEQLRDDLTGIAAALAAFTLAMLAGQKTPGQIRGWLKLQSKKVFRTFHRTERLTQKSILSHNEALRMLDPFVIHCPECPAYDTGGQWLAIDDVVPATVACTCGPNCRCTVITRFNPARAIGIIGEASLVDAVISP